MRRKRKDRPTFQENEAEMSRRPQTIPCHLQLAASPHACICRPHFFVLVHQQAGGPPPPVFLAEILLFLVRLSLCGNINILAETLTCGVRSIFEHSHQTSLLVIYFVSFNNIYESQPLMLARGRASWLNSQLSFVQ